MGKPGNNGFKRILNAWGYSIKGLRAAWQHEAAFRQETLLAMVLLPLSFLVAGTGVQLAILLLCLFVVVITEMLNSAIEAVVDRIGDEHNELAGRAKDMGSAAVFLALAMTVIVWISVLFDRFLA